jgi:hypothetical protein
MGLSIVDLKKTKRLSDSSYKAATVRMCEKILINLVTDLRADSYKEPPVMVALRNTVIGLMRKAGGSNMDGFVNGLVVFPA